MFLFQNGIYIAFSFIFFDRASKRKKKIYEIIIEIIKNKNELLCLRPSAAV